MFDRVEHEREETFVVVESFLQALFTERSAWEPCANACAAGPARQRHVCDVANLDVGWITMQLFQHRPKAFALIYNIHERDWPLALDYGPVWAANACEW